MMNIKKHCLSACDEKGFRVKRLDSPFYNERPDQGHISLLVVHNISLPSQSFVSEHIENLFMGSLDCSLHPSFHDLEGVKVSAHVFIKRCGEVIQFVPFDKRAWHAGVSSWLGRENCNDYSIGIEMQGSDNIPYTHAQYHSLMCVTQLLIDKYQLSMDNIVGHEDIAPGRKTDPGCAFDWLYFKSGLRAYDHNEVS